MQACSVVQAGFCCVWLLAVTGLDAPRASAQVTETQAATTISAELAAILSNFAAQRDALGGWPARVQDAYTALGQLKTQFDTARAAGDNAQARRLYRAAMKIATRISRWLVNQYDSSNEDISARDKVEAIVARFQKRMDLLTSLANQAGVTLDLRAVNTARMQVQTARASGTDAQLRTAVRALRDALDALQDSLTDANP